MLACEISNSIYSSHYQERVIEQVQCAVGSGQGISATETTLPEEIVTTSSYVSDYFSDRIPTVKEAGACFYQRDRFAATVTAPKLIRHTKEVAAVHRQLVQQALGYRAVWTMVAHNSQIPGAEGVSHVDEGVGISFTFNEGHTRLTYAQTQEEYEDEVLRQKIDIVESGFGVALGDTFLSSLTPHKNLSPPIHRWQELSNVESRRSLVLSFLVLPIKIKKPK